MADFNIDLDAIRAGFDPDFFMETVDVAFDLLAENNDIFKDVNTFSKFAEFVPIFAFPQQFEAGRGLLH